jgi:integrase
MKRAMTKVGSNGKALALAENLERVKRHLENAKSESTKRVYKIHWADFKMFCDEHGLMAMPAEPETLALYISDQIAGGKSISTVDARLAAISVAHNTAGFENLQNPVYSELVKQTFQGIKREKGVAPKKKKPLMSDDIKRMVDALDSTRLIDLRDKAILLIGFSGAFRRSEIAGLKINDVEFSKAGMTVTLRRSKIDQKGHGHKRGIPYGSHVEFCPVRILKDWIEAAGIKSGYLFRSVKKGCTTVQGQRLDGRDVERIVRKVAKRVGFDTDDLGGHSLRSGFATQAATNRARLEKIMDHGGWKTVAIVKGYIRDGNLFRDNAAAVLEL